MCKVYDEFPEFKAVDPEELNGIIQHSHLSKLDRRIATDRLIEFKYYADIAADVHSNRTTVSYRMRNIIAPVIRKHI